MAKSGLPPLGGTCALATAVTGPLGTATACPSPNSWTPTEVAAYMGGEGKFGGGYTAIFHDRATASLTSLSLDCWSRAKTAGIV